jgi:hypothetical protein
MTFAGALLLTFNVAILFAIGARGKEFQRAPAAGLGAAPAAWGWHLIFLLIRPFQIESVRFELRFCFFEARRVTIHCMAGRETGSTDDAWERHGLFRCGAFIAARSHRPSTIFGNAPRTSGINCSRGDAQIGGYPPLPLKKNWTPKWGVCPAGCATRCRLYGARWWVDASVGTGGAGAEPGHFP